METDSGALEALPFEKAVEKLEGIVERLEAGDNSLADMVSHYHQGMLLMNHCQRQLKAAELAIAQLSRSDA